MAIGSTPRPRLRGMRDRLYRRQRATAPEPHGEEPPQGAEQKRPGWKRTAGSFFLLWLCFGQRGASTFPFHRCG